MVKLEAELVLDHCRKYCCRRWGAAGRSGQRAGARHNRRRRQGEKAVRAHGQGGPCGAQAPTTDGKSSSSVLLVANASAACSAACRRVGSSLFQHVQQQLQTLCHTWQALPCIDPRSAPAAWSPWTCRRRAWRWACRRASSRPTTSRRWTWTSATTTSTTTSSEKRTFDAGGMCRRRPIVGSSPLGSDLLCVAVQR